MRIAMSAQGPQQLPPMENLRFTSAERASERWAFDRRLSRQASLAYENRIAGSPRVRGVILIVVAIALAVTLAVAYWADTRRHPAFQAD